MSQPRTLAWCSFGPRPERSCWASWRRTNSPWAAHPSTCPGRRRAIRGTRNISLPDRPPAPAPRVASGMVLGGTGSDTGGSIRGPAARCAGWPVSSPLTACVLARWRTCRCPTRWTTHWPARLDCRGLCAAAAGDGRARPELDPASADRPTPDFTAGLGKGVKGCVAWRATSRYCCRRWPGTTRAIPPARIVRHPVHRGLGKGVEGAAHRRGAPFLRDRQPGERYHPEGHRRRAGPFPRDGRRNHAT